MIYDDVIMNNTDIYLYIYIHIHTYSIICVHIYIYSSQIGVTITKRSFARIQRLLLADDHHCIPQHLTLNLPFLVAFPIMYLVVGTRDYHMGIPNDEALV